MSEAIEPGLEMAERQDRFVAEHLRRIFAQIYHIVRNVADAQDLTQEAFIKALQHQEQLKDEQKAAHWLSRIATNTAIDFLGGAGGRSSVKSTTRITQVRRARNNSFCAASIANTWKTVCGC